MAIQFLSIKLNSPVTPYTSGSVTDLVLANTEIQDMDVVVITSKIVAILEGRAINLETVRASKSSVRLAKIYDLDPRTVELVRRQGKIKFMVPFKAFLKSRTIRENLVSLLNRDVPEKEILRIGDNFKYVMVTHNHGLLMDSAGIDYSNMPEGFACLFLSDPSKSALQIRKEIKARTGKDVAVIVTDTLGGSQRLKGTWDLPVGFSGIDPVERNVGGRDIFGKYSTGGRGNFILPLASMAGLVQGNSDECSPITIVRGLKYVPMEDSGLGFSALQLNWRAPAWALLTTALSTAWFQLVMLWIRLTTWKEWSHQTSGIAKSVCSLQTQNPKPISRG